MSKALRYEYMLSLLTRDHSFTCLCPPCICPQLEWAMAVFTPQLQSITALWQLLLSRSRESRRLTRCGWLVTHRDCLHTHPSTNWAWHIVTSLMAPMLLQLPQTTTASYWQCHRLSQSHITGSEHEEQPRFMEGCVCIGTPYTCFPSSDTGIPAPTLILTLTLTLPQYST